MKKKRIGLILASIHSGSSGQVCSNLIHEAAYFDATFYIFPGGRLNALQNSECLRNPVYKLANKKNVDGLISWASTLGGVVPLPELVEFHKKIEPLPFVTISQKIEGHSCVNFNAYDGMVDLVKHFLFVHHINKIAFLRGPENHVSANDRYRAFCDTLQSAGIAVENSPLISDSFEWRNGTDAIKQLFEERHLVPGKDFEALVAASDIMIFDAIAYLQKQGFSVPDDYTAGGFNDVSKSRMLLSALSTVHLPYKSMSLDSFELIVNEIDNPLVLKRNIVLSAPLVIRESCGCSLSSLFEDAKPPVDKDMTARKLVKEQETLISDLTKLLRLDKTNQNAIIEPILNAIWSKSTDLLYNLFTKASRRFCENDMDNRLMYRALACIKKSPSVDFDYINSIEKNLLLILGQVSEQYQEEIKSLREEYNKILDSLKCVLISNHSISGLIEALHTYLPQIGIHTAATVLYNDDKTSRFCGGFAKNKVFDDGEIFPIDEITPSHLSTAFSNDIFLVQPLFAENKTIGHFVCSLPFFDGMLFEDLRSVVSSAFSGIFLFNEMTVARKVAEDAEQAKTKFFAAVGNDLSEPLHEISESASELEAMLNRSDMLSGRLKTVVEKLKGSLDKQLERTHLIVELTRSQSNEIDFHNHLFHPEDLLVDLQQDFSLPLLCGDKQRLQQALSLFAKNFNFDLRACKIQQVPEGVKFILPCDMTDGTASIWKESGVMLASQILLMQNCEFVKKEMPCELLFHWPDFSCSKEKGDQSEVLEQEPFIWNFKGRTNQEIRSIYNMREKSDFIHRPFLCYSAEKSENIEKNADFVSLFEYTLGISGQPVLIAGGFQGIEKKWNLPVPIIHVDTNFEIEKVLNNSNPAIIVMNGIDIPLVSLIRNKVETELSPIIIISEKIDQSPELDKLRTIQKVILCNECVAASPEFGSRLRAILSGDSMLSPDTGSIVKKAIIYFNRYGHDYISRWKLSEAVHTSEDYLTRIFHKETGLSPWEYLSLYRVNLACIQLRQTNDSISLIAEKSGFQDQAYFCRVFKKITGTTPGRYRKGLESD